MEQSLLVKRKKKLAEEKFMEIEKEKNQTILINLYTEILNINNTDQNIVLNYLLFVKEIHKDGVICQFTQKMIFMIIYIFFLLKLGIIILEL